MSHKSQQEQDFATMNHPPNRITISRVQDPYMSDVASFASEGDTAHEKSGVYSGVHSSTNSVESRGSSRKEMAETMEKAAGDMNIKLHTESISMVVDGALEAQNSALLSYRSYDNNSKVTENLWSANEEVHERMKTGWRNQRSFLVWLGLYYTISMLLFVFKVTNLLSNEAAMNLFSPCLAYTRAAALLINFNAMLVLFPVSRHLMTWVQSRHRLRTLFAFDAAIDGHALFGGAILLFAFAHSILHCFTYHNFVNADYEDVVGFFGEEVAKTLPSTRHGRIMFMLQQRATITGIAMWICMIAGFSVIRNRRKNFNRFWYFHHLLLLMLILVAIHGTGNLVEKGKTWRWLVVPFAAYFIPRLWRELSTKTVKLLSFQVCGDIVELRVEKPHSWRLYQKPGMYGLINIPAVSKFEWHPFTMSSSPHEDHLAFHINCCGDWTRSMRDYLVQSSRTSFGVLDVPIRVEGPFGAPCQGARDFESVVLVGAGIGVTPMMSTLKGMLHKPGRTRKVYFYWTTRDSGSFQLFAKQMDQLYDMDTENMLVVRHFLTSGKHAKEDDPDSVLFQNIVDDIYSKTNIDVRLGHRTNEPMSVGRPNWKDELASIMEENWDMCIANSGVFLCGGEAMAVGLQTACVELSQSRKGHLYFTKETF